MRPTLSAECARLPPVHAEGIGAWWGRMAVCTPAAPEPSSFTSVTFMAKERRLGAARCSSDGVAVSAAGVSSERVCEPSPAGPGRQCWHSPGLPAPARYA